MWRARTTPPPTGVEIEKTIEHTTLEEWNRIFAVNAGGMFFITKHLLPNLRRSDGAPVINFGSYGGFVADPNLAAYSPTKRAVDPLTRGMACEHGPEGIRVNAIRNVRGHREPRELACFGRSAICEPPAMDS